MHVRSIPFYIAAPTTTVDPSLPEGSLIPIEERNPTEVTHHQGQQVAAPNIHVRHSQPCLLPVCLQSS